MASVRRSLASSEVTINTLLSGTAWSGPVGFGFGSALSGSSVSAVNGAAPSPALTGAVAAAFAQVAAFTNLSARWTSTANADVRVVAADALAFSGGQMLPLGAYAFFPGGAVGGDAAFGPSVTADLAPGSYGFRTVLHEIGHALGLKHPHEPAPYGALPAARDSPEHSVMSARSHASAPLTEGLGAEPGGFSQTYMPADVAALQHLYGANFSDNGNTRYRFDPYERVTLRTIWDGGGHDTYDFSGFVTPLAISLQPGGHSQTGQEPQLNRAQELSNGAAPVRADGAIHNAALYRGHAASWIEDAVGGHGRDTITGNGAHNRLNGRDGSDLIRAGTGHDVLVGGGGDDTLVGQAGNDRLFGDIGTDVLAGGEGDDLLSGGGHADRLYGARGNDILLGGEGDDALFAFQGDDRLIGQLGNDRLDGGFGHDRMNGGPGTDHMVAGPGSDIMLGEAGDDWMIGNTGGDILSGGNGNDALFGLDGADTLFGNNGRDRLDGGSGNDRIHGGTGNDRILGGTGDDTLYGEMGDDHLIGGDGDDFLAGGRGTNHFTGGAGADTFYLAPGSTVSDLSSIDRIRLPASVSPDAARQIGANVVFNLPGSAEIVLEGVTLADLFAEMFI